MPPNDSPTALTADNARDVAALLEERRRGFEQVMWQVPSLSITAQAFLFAAAFGSDTPQYARVIVAVLGLAAVLAAMHLLAKHRYLESLHGQVHMACLRQLGAPALYREALHGLLAVEGRPEIGAAAWRGGLLSRLVIDLQAFHVWMLTLAAFAVADAYLLLRALL